MSIYVYTEQLTDTCSKLIKQLDAKLIRKFDGMYFLHKNKPISFGPTDVVICWGKHVPQVDVPILNANLKYHTQLSVNLHKAQRLDFESHNVVGLIPRLNFKAGNHATAVEELANNGPVKNRSVPCKELVGYWHSWYNGFLEDYKIHMFFGKVVFAELRKKNGTRVVVTELPEHLQTIARMQLKHLGLAFGVVTLNTMAENVVCVRKIITAPTLSDEVIAIYAAHIKVWADKNISKQQNIKELASFLGESANVGS